MIRSCFLRAFVVTTIFCSSLAPVLHAEASSVDNPRISASLIVIGTTLDPTFSMILVDLPLPVVGVSGPWEKVSLRTWYLAKSAYLLPFRFAETSVVANYNWGSTELPWLVSGLGVGYSNTAGVSSTPGILSLDWNWNFSPMFIVTPSLLCLVYGEGFIVETKFQSRVSLGSGGPFLVVGGQVSVGYDFKVQVPGTMLGLYSGLGYRW